MSKLVIVLVALAIAQPVFGQTQPAARASAPFGVLRPAQSDPYRKLFVPQTAKQNVVKLATLPQPATPKVVCGMTMVPADPAIDRMPLPRANDSVDFKIRALDPPICNPAR